MAVTLDDLGCGYNDEPCTLQLQINGICCPPEPTLSPNPICPDGESFSIVEVRARRTVYFRLEDNEEGCQLEYLCPTMVTGNGCDNEKFWRARVRSGTAPGNGRVWVVAYYATDSTCAGRTLLELGCGSCNGDCTAGAGRASNGSVEWEMLLGKSMDGKSAGKLLLYSDEANETLVSPKSLLLSTQRPDVIVLRGADGAIQQVKAPQILAEVVDSDPNDRAYAVQFYKSSQVSNWSDAGGPWYPYGTPYKTWAISSPDSSYAQLQIDEAIDGVTQRGYHYVYSVTTPGAEWQWQLSIRDATSNALLRTETVAWELVASGQWARTTTVEQDGGVTEKTIETLIEINGDKRVVERVVDPDGAALTTYFGYY
ncbi:MAG: hypothetical protein HZB38_19190 [Planctomycetes bacterium]|nr:hypothetical protein [Planctomycetota bacterium]